MSTQAPGPHRHDVMSFIFKSGNRAIFNVWWSSPKRGRFCIVYKLAGRRQGCDRDVTGL